MEDQDKCRKTWTSAATAAAGWCRCQCHNTYLGSLPAKPSQLAACTLVTSLIGAVSHHN